jgi:hypothetical protein
MTKSALLQSLAEFMRARVTIVSALLNRTAIGRSALFCFAISGILRRSGRTTLNAF